MTNVLDDTDATRLGGEPVYCQGRAVGKTASAAIGYRFGKLVAPAFDPAGERMRRRTQS
ncbi:MAG: hypothetical protein ACR2OJ_05445 [Hyphomicrobiales bacterium]